MHFKDFLLNENPHRTACKACNYPPQWDTHGVNEIDVPLVGHIATGADFLVWLELKPIDYKWQNYERAFGDEPIAKPTWTQTPLVQQIRKHVHVIL
jgi:hypothetical protein